MEVTQIQFLDIEENLEYVKEIQKVISQCFLEEKLENSNLYISITLTNPENIRKINKEYRNIDKETDVISFALEDDKTIKNDNIRVLGDIYISIDKAKEQAIEYNHSLKRELCFLMTHGFLHLLGYDHMKKEDEEIMFPLQEKILNEYGVNRNE